MYQYIPVCTMFTNIFMRLLVCVLWLSETILCMRDMYAVVLQQWISAPICVKYAWLCSGSYSVHTGMYFEVSYIRVHTSTYRYVPVQTRYTPKTLFLYHWSRFQMCLLDGSWAHLGLRLGGDDMCVYNTILNIILTIFDHLGQNMHILLCYFIFK